MVIRTYLASVISGDASLSSDPQIAVTIHEDCTYLHLRESVSDGELGIWNGDASGLTHSLDAGHKEQKCQECRTITHCVKIRDWLQL